MLKLAILLAVATLSFASDVDEIVGDLTPVAVILKKDEPYPHCATYIVKKTDVTCNCKNRPNLPMIELGHHDSNMTLEVIPIIVRSKEEAVAVVETKVKDCVCGPKNYQAEPGIIQIINDNYYITYLWKGGDTIETAILNRKKLDSRAEYEAVIKAIDFDKAKEYKQVCNKFTD